MSVALSGWHPGERSIQARLHYAEAMTVAYTWVQGSMPEQHRQFHSRNLPFVPLTTLDADGRPWSSIVTGKSGEPGFISSPNESELAMNLMLWPGDPILDNLDLFENTGGKLLVAGLGIEFPTRRRNKFAGWIFQTDKSGESSREIRLHVSQAIGNCPKYINIRDLDPHPQTSPQIIHRKLQLASGERLPEDLINFVLTSDTVFLGTTYKAEERIKDLFPSHVGMNARGGRPGFIRVKPSDGRTIILPDYSGKYSNRLLTSLGNIDATPLASMSFLDFATGDILYLTGTAKNLVGPEAQKVMPRQNLVTAMYVEGYIFIRDALPVRQRLGSSVGRSPYSPPIKYLAEERGSDTSLDDVFATLARVRVLSPNLATFTFTTSSPVVIRPGQAAVLDFTDLLGTQQYAHMAPGDEARVNDDRIRTWTVSSAHTSGETRKFDLTMREKPGGLVTGALFALVRNATAKRPELLDDASPLDLRIKLVGIAGEFTIPQQLPAEKRFLWIAGGIGVTPFLSMLAALSSSPGSSSYEITFVLSTREPDILLGLIRDVLPASGSPDAPRILLHLFTAQSTPIPALPGSVKVFEHKKRLRSPEFLPLIADAKGRLIYLCGPLAFEEMAMEALMNVHVDTATIVREGFGY